MIIESIMNIAPIMCWMLTFVMASMIATAIYKWINGDTYGTTQIIVACGLILGMIVFVMPNIQTQVTNTPRYETVKERTIILNKYVDTDTFIFPVWTGSYVIPIPITDRDRVFELDNGKTVWVNKGTYDLYRIGDTYIYQYERLIE